MGGAPRPGQAPAPAALGAEAVPESGPPGQHWPGGSQSDPTLAKAAADLQTQAPEPMERAPDTGIYEAPPAPFEPPVAPVAFEPAPAPVQVERAAVPMPIEQVPPPVPVEPPAPAAEERAAPAPAGEPDADRR